ncbi:MAG: hypothetical protein JNK48_31645 [Bryobacterales bacterium]|nr:hypothetical protein [Bryobacterales bacterium]
MHSELRRRLHWGIGMTALLLFLLSGAYMRWVRQPAVIAEVPEIRAVYRSRHLLLLLTAVANLAFAAGGARRSLCTSAASWVLGTAPLLFAVAFWTEPELGVAGRTFSTPALYALFAAAVAMAIGARPRPNSTSADAVSASK